MAILNLLLLAACAPPSVTLHVRLPTVTTAIRVPLSAYIWHDKDEGCDPWILNRHDRLAILEVRGDGASFGGVEIPFPSPVEFETANHAIVGVMGPMADAQAAWAERCGGETSYLIAVDASAPSTLLILPNRVQAGLAGVLVDDEGAQAGADAPPGVEERMVELEWEDGGLTLRTPKRAVPGTEPLQDVRHFRRPLVGCAVFAVTQPATVETFTHTWDELRGRGVRRVDLAFSEEEKKALPPPAPDLPGVTLSPSDTVALLPEYSIPGYEKGGTIRCGTDEWSDRPVPNIECDCMQYESSDDDPPRTLDDALREITGPPPP